MYACLCIFVCVCIYVTLSQDSGLWQGTQHQDSRLLPQEATPSEARQGMTQKGSDIVLTCWGSNKG